jgi:hypothetical protein
MHFKLTPLEDFPEPTSQLQERERNEAVHAVMALTDAHAKQLSNAIAWAFVIGVATGAAFMGLVL